MMTTRPTTAIDTIANQYVTDYCQLDPTMATSLGRPGMDHLLPDASPDGAAKAAQLDRDTLAAINAATPHDAIDRVTVAAMNERLGLSIEMMEAGEYLHDLNVIASPLQIRDIFDIMPTDTPEQWMAIAQRMQAMPEFLQGYAQTLSVGVHSGKPFAARQVDRGITYATKQAQAGDFFDTFADQGRQACAQDASVCEALTKGAQAARQAHGEFAAFLQREIAPRCVEQDAVGAERYARASRLFLGATVDLQETYEWGIEELGRVISAQQATARELYGEGVSIEEAMERLDADETRQIKGTDALKAWMQTTADAAIAALQDVHFDIPEPARALECCIAPSNSGGIYYTGPSDDFARPGRMWWSVPDGVTDFGTWREKTTVYHEGVPGHHLQIAQTVFRRELLNDWRRNMCWVSGHGEGWALYAEQLMAELGFLNDPGDRLGMLDGQRLRAARVVLDIGVHLSLPTPASMGLDGMPWNADVAWEFLKANANMDEAFLAFELDRYLGWAGQAPAYKVGQRIWEQLRAQAQTAAGDAFDLKAFHRQALDLGSLGLDVMGQALRGEL